MVTSCSCLCCHYKDSSCVYTGIDQCIDCQGKYTLQGGKVAWTSPYFACEKNCLRSTKSSFSNNFSTVSEKYLNNVRNTQANATRKTLLHSAVLASDPELTWDLLCRGANPFVKDRMGVTPIDLARLMYSGIVNSSEFSNEKKVYDVLPKLAYPEVSIEFPLESVELCKIRTQSDLGPEPILPLAHSVSPDSSRRRKLIVNHRQSPPQMKQRKQYNESSQDKSVLSCSVGSLDNETPICVSPPTVTTGKHRRQRSQTMSPTNAVVYPPSPPRVKFVDNFSKQSSPGRRKGRHRSQTLTDDVTGTTGGPFTTPAQGSYGFDRRKRGMSLTDFPSDASGSRSILTGIVNAGIRHAKANAPKLSEGKQVFSTFTLLKLNEGNDFVMEELKKMPPVTEEDATDLDDSLTDSPGHGRTDNFKANVKKPAKKEHHWEMLHLKNTIISEVEMESRSSQASIFAITKNFSSDESTDDDKGEPVGDFYAEFAKSLDRKKTPPLVTPMEEQEDSFDNNAAVVSCTGCMDLLPLSKMSYSCLRPGCSSHLCQECLFRLVFVTITSALYAVPAIRCPGRCLCAIPTRTWRGGLKNMKVAEDDKRAIKVDDVTIVKLLDLLYDSFEVMCGDYENGVIDDTARMQHTCSLLSRVEDIAKFDGFTLNDVYNSVNKYSASVATKSSGGDDGNESSEWEEDSEDDDFFDDEYEEKEKKSKEANEVSEKVEEDENIDVEESHNFESFSEFASYVLPGKVVEDSNVGDTFLAMEDILNNSDVESARLNVKCLRKKHLHNFLAEVAALVRNRLDLGTICSKFMEDDLKEDAEALLMRRYMSNAQALMKIRCSGCDETVNLFHVIENGKKVITAPAERDTMLNKILAKINTQENAMNFLRTYCNFLNGKAPASLFISTVFESFINTKKCDFEEDEMDRNEDIRKSAKNGVLKLEAVKYMTKILSLIVDVERRFAAQLEMLRKFPKIKLLCCDTKHCFLCKVGGHHKGQSCAEVQQAEMGKECQYCPGCGVATLRTEGCKEVLCVCGAVWKWDNDDEESSTEGDWESEDSDSDSDGDY